MGNREVKWRDDEKCDYCKKFGAWDFYDDMICDDCLKELEKKSKKD